MGRWKLCGLIRGAVKLTIASKELSRRMGGRVFMRVSGGVGTQGARMWGSPFQSFSQHPSHPFSFPVDLKSLLDLSCSAFAQLPWPRPRGTSSALPAAGVALEESLMPGPRKASCP